MKHEKLTRRTICKRSLASVLGSLLEGSILCTNKGTLPVPSFSTNRWLRKSSSLERSDMFIILVKRHSESEPLEDVVLALAIEGIGTPEERCERAKERG